MIFKIPCARRPANRNMGLSWTKMVRVIRRGQVPQEYVVIPHFCLKRELRFSHRLLWRLFLLRKPVWRTSCGAQAGLSCGSCTFSVLPSWVLAWQWCMAAIRHPRGRAACQASSFCPSPVRYFWRLR